MKIKKAPSSSKGSHTSVLKVESQTSVPRTAQILAGICPSAVSRSPHCTSDTVINEATQGRRDRTTATTQPRSVEPVEAASEASSAQQRAGAALEQRFHILALRELHVPSPPSLSCCSRTHRGFFFSPSATYYSPRLKLTY